MRVNQKIPPVKTYEGAPAKRIKSIDELRRTVMACMLWENQFYEDGISIADRIANLIKSISDNEAIKIIASEARNRQHLRHVPLLIARELARKKGVVIKDLLADIIQRPDELCEFLALYWMDGKQPLSGQVKKGLAEAFKKFGEYSLAKYNRPDAIKLKDVLFMVHPKPKDDDQQKVWDRLVEDKLTIPDTWEVRLSGGQDKHEVWSELIKERKLGGLAYLRNLRNMLQAKIPDKIIADGLIDINVSKVLPFRFITAARYAPRFEPELEKLMFKSLAEKPKLRGKIIVLVDVSGSMDVALSDRSEAIRMDAGCGLAMMIKEVSTDCKVFSFSNHTKEIPPRRGFALRDSILQSQDHGGTMLGAAVNHANQIGYDLLIVITDEQSHDVVPDPKGKGYMINVASYQRGVGYGKWTHLDGWSDSIVDWITEYETAEWC